MSTKVNVVPDENGNLPSFMQAGRNAQNPFSGSATVTKNFVTPQNAFVIANDGATPLTFTINGDTYTVNSGGVFDENFAPFSSVTVTTTVAFRAYTLG
jgi:hypothetical protein